MSHKQERYCLHIRNKVIQFLKVFVLFLAYQLFIKNRSKKFKITTIFIFNADIRTVLNLAMLVLKTVKSAVWFKIFDQHVFFFFFFETFLLIKFLKIEKKRSKLK